jgi:hypothetical protein
MSEESYLFSLRRRTAQCGCSEDGPGEHCILGQQLFNDLRQAYREVSGIPPWSNIRWSAYETLRARCYAHLGEQVNYLNTSVSIPLKRDTDVIKQDEPLYCGQVRVDITALAVVSQSQTLLIEKPLPRSAIIALAKDCVGSEHWLHDGYQPETLDVVIKSHPL